MSANFRHLSILFLTVLLITGCQRITEDFISEDLADFLPLQVGRSITYRLDSTVFTNFGRNEEIHSYQEKNDVAALITDNLGRPSYRINRFIRNLAGTQPWQAAGTYFITPLEQTIEVVENNLRVIRLFKPMAEGTTWRGNRYLPTDPYGEKYEFSNDDNMDKWDFTREGGFESLTLNGKTIDSVITITHIKELINIPITDPQSYASQTVSVDKYAKGIGLVYQEFIMWEQQPNLSGSTPFKIGFGVKRSLLDYK